MHGEVMKYGKGKTINQTCFINKFSHKPRSTADHIVNILKTFAYSHCAAHRLDTVIIKVRRNDPTVLFAPSVE